MRDRLRHASSFAPILHEGFKRGQGNRGSLAPFWNPPIPPVPGLRIFAGKNATRPSGGYGLRGIKIFCFDKMPRMDARANRYVQGDASGNEFQRYCDWRSFVPLAAGVSRRLAQSAYEKLTPSPCTHPPIRARRLRRTIHRRSVSHPNARCPPPGTHIETA